MSTERYVDYLPLGEIKFAPRNPKGHDSRGINRMLRHHGLAELPCLDERTGRLAAGHGRIEQLRQLHADDKPAPRGVRVRDDGEWLVPVLRGWASPSDEDAESYLIGSNQTAINGGWDDMRELAEILSDLADLQLLEVSGWDTDRLQDLLRETDTLGDAAAAMLGPHPDTGGPDDADDIERSDRPPEASSDYVVVQWTVLPTERRLVRDAVAAAQARWETATAAQALIALCRHFIDETQGASV